jgi:Cu(I)/Ag(I) efflux system membrane fusion protein
MTIHKDIENSNFRILQANSMSDARTAFDKLSIAMIKLARQTGTGSGQPVYLYHCPMAFDNRGADWLQNRKGTENPYYGSKMFTCGTLEEVITDTVRSPQGGNGDE